MHIVSTERRLHWINSLCNDSYQWGEKIGECDLVTRIIIICIIISSIIIILLCNPILVFNLRPSWAIASGSKCLKILLVCYQFSEVVDVVVVIHLALEKLFTERWMLTERKFSTDKNVRKIFLIDLSGRRVRHDQAVYDWGTEGREI